MHYYESNKRMEILIGRILDEAKSRGRQLSVSKLCCFVEERTFYSQIAIKRKIYLLERKRKDFGIWGDNIIFGKLRTEIHLIGMENDMSSLIESLAIDKKAKDLNKTEPQEKPKEEGGLKWI